MVFPQESLENKFYCLYLSICYRMLYWKHIHIHHVFMLLHKGRMIKACTHDSAVGFQKAAKHLTMATTLCLGVGENFLNEASLAGISEWPKALLGHLIYVIRKHLPWLQFIILISGLSHKWWTNLWAYQQCQTSPLVIFPNLSWWDMQQLQVLSLHHSFTWQTFIEQLLHVWPVGPPGSYWLETRSEQLCTAGAVWSVIQATQQFPPWEYGHKGRASVEPQYGKSEGCRLRVRDAGRERG